ncbi:MAG: hypothetical protein HQ582_12480 [Planctomycetes bacterium]|nr:hypothetical protein [Planctomycetota bacterium]
MRHCLVLSALMVPFALVSHAAESLTDGLVGYVACDDSLRIAAPAGVEHAARFTRAGQAFTEDLQHVVANEPRFEPGRFGRGIFVEPGYESTQKHSSRNYLPPEAAQMRVPDGEALPYVEVGDAEVTLSRTAGGETTPFALRLAKKSRAIHVACTRAGTGAELREPVALIPGSYTVSCFGRSLAADRQLRIEVIGGEETLAAADRPIGTAWTRIELPFQRGRFTRDTSEQEPKPVTVRFLSTQPGESLFVAGVVVEMHGGYSYAGTQGATSWLPGHGYRASDVLDVSILRHWLRGRRGSVAFWAMTKGGPQSWRTLFELGDHNRWQPFLQLLFRPENRLCLSGQSKKPLTAGGGVTVPPETWRHYAMTWTADSATAYLDGEAVVKLDGLQIPTELHTVRLGSSGPNAPARAVIDEALFYNRPLSGAEVAILAGRQTPFMEPPTGVALQPIGYIRTIARTVTLQSWTCAVSNHGARPADGLTVQFQLADHIRLAQSVPPVAPGGTTPVEFHFIPDLEMGCYPLRVILSRAGRTVARFEAEVEITPAAEPIGNLQTLAWGSNADREYGITFGGGDLTEAMRDGLHYAPHLHYLCYPRAMDGEDWVLGMGDRPFRPKITHPYIRAQIDREARRFAGQYTPIQALRAVILNSEMQWLWQHDYSPERMAWVKQRFGLDLTPWRYPPERGGEAVFQTPFGRLKPSVAKIELPGNRVIELDAPIYAYHRWFHGPDGPTESYLNQRISDAIHEVRPDILTIQEPILRRAAVRAFDRVNLAQEWFNYQDPMAAVTVQERLNAACRGTGLRPTGMPQFLFKAGGAAPYNSIPTADLYREAAWLCAMQPIRMFTYWNFAVVPSDDFENAYSQCMTKRQLDEFFGTPTPTWDEAKAKLEEEPDVARKLMPWTPELIETFIRFHTEEIGPLGGLIPQWRNRPRRIAVLRSFASQIFREVRWPRNSWLENCAVYGGVPFDVLYDSDFEAEADPLAGCRMLIVSRAVCLTRPAYRWICEFSKRGGAVVIDSETLVEIPGAVCLEPTQSLDRFRDALAEEEKALQDEGVAVDSPRYVEAMSHWARKDGGPVGVERDFVDLIEKNVDPEARTLTMNTWLNALEADGANYIAVVNNLRTLGPMYGHFGKVREKGVPQTARVVFDPALGAVAYDLVRHEEIALDVQDGKATLTLDVPAAGGRLLVLLDRPVASLRLTAQVGNATWGNQNGHEILVAATLLDADGKPVEGLIPATVTITRPDGRRSDYSRHVVFRRGQLNYRFPVAVNAPRGAWHVTVVERATGKTQRAVLALDANE